MQSNNNNDSKILKISVFGGLLFTIMGITWGIAANSQMIIFDGLYSFISLGLSLMSLFAYSFIKKEDQERFQYGKDVIKPLVIIFKASAIIAMCLFAFSTSIIDLFKGGREVVIGSAALYALIATVLCAVIYSFMKNKQGNSEFVKAEAAQWLMDTILSGAVLIGFVIALLLKQTTFAFLTPYVDPIMVLIISLYFLKVPFQMLIKNAKELLWMAPSAQIQLQITQAVQETKEKYNIFEDFTRVTKVGKTIFIEIDFVLGEHTSIQTVDEFDRVREELYQKLQMEGHTNWFTLSFTKDRKWAL
ncbi:cation diffusion facilitator family transporter [Alteribacillus bidgolensis]|uniref:Cation diffusion facilitator family transporter n=1 Tax=Alteribacillus bidgolensis TaxID=930129 RepID=A0A1G8E6U8_9BACI|nr:cation diffusion facilitator family transporter [Alteribacillus bidgolensis]SDH65662.1 cation diffusion facilitator family transporter [Alteribacillus bidgolensis]